MSVGIDPIVIVGAGPTGLCLALKLGRAGIFCRVLESEPKLTHDLRAGSYHPPTIEMLASVGVGAAIHARGLKVPIWQIRDRLEGVVAQFDLSVLADQTPYPYRLHLEQHRLTALLLEEIGRSAPNVEVAFSKPVVGLVQDADGVTVTLESGEAIRASFVVGCDGARSVVRVALGLEFEGFTWPERFLVASTSYDLSTIGFAGAGYIADPEHWAAVFRVPDKGPPGLWRIAYGTDPSLPEEQVLDPASIQSRLRIILEHAQPDVGAFPLAYASTYRVHQRVARRFWSRRVAIAGDAAHLNNPLGGFGLNGGIHDALNLGEKLIRVSREGASHAALFDHYDRQRRPINISAVQAMSIRNKRLLAETDPAERRASLRELRRTAADRDSARAFLLDSSMLNSVKQAAAVPENCRPGDPFENEDIWALGERAVSQSNP